MAYARTERFLLIVYAGRIMDLGTMDNAGYTFALNGRFGKLLNIWSGLLLLKWSSLLSNTKF